MDPNKLWAKFTRLVNSCSQLRLLNLKGYSNMDETKYHLLPHNKTEGCTVVSLGIGRDVGVELQLKEDEPNCKFFGADPVEEINKQIYEKFGTFYHTAVGAANGTFDATILDPNSGSYNNKTVHYRKFHSFLQEDINQPLIDQLMIDIEYAEYGLLPQLLLANRPQGITLCQINMEIHAGSSSQKLEFSKFINQLLTEQEFVPLRTATMLGHIRLYLLNMANETCRRRYIDKMLAE